MDMLRRLINYRIIIIIITCDRVRMCERWSSLEFAVCRNWVTLLLTTYRSPPTHVPEVLPAIHCETYRILRCSIYQIPTSVGLFKYWFSCQKLDQSAIFIRPTQVCRPIELLIVCLQCATPLAAYVCAWLA